MELSGERRIPAPREAVWRALNDPEILRHCIPGCEALEKVSETEYDARVTAKVGPVKAAFTTRITLSDLDPPKHYRLSGEGKGGAAGFARGGADVDLEASNGETVLRYQADVKIGGKLAQVGQRLVDSTARKLADDFFTRFAERVSSTTGAAGGGEGGEEEEQAQRASAAREKPRRSLAPFAVAVALVAVALAVWLAGG